MCIRTKVFLIDVTYWNIDYCKCTVFVLFRTVCKKMHKNPIRTTLFAPVLKKYGFRTLVML